ncbi:hypothetical protein K440DRAFT_617852 [Wilcoxina mikolae CBS 423.85]|nr:hypothetical protein K440DRAFT_617852 [Wilcoxina mikolae CBS 423.85]
MLTRRRVSDCEQRLTWIASTEAPTPSLAHEKALDCTGDEDASQHSGSSSSRMRGRWWLMSFSCGFAVVITPGRAVNEWRSFCRDLV